MRIVRGFLIILGLAALWAVCGCATTTEISNLNTQIEDLYREVGTLKAKMSSDVPQRRADMETTIEDVRREIAMLKTNIEEDRDRMQRLSDEVHMLKLEQQSKMAATAPVVKEPAPVPSPTTGTVVPSPSPPAPPKVEDMEGAYQKAYGTFRDGNYPQAITQFERFLKEYPQSEYADNAQYWVAESYYMQADYERAILEYEKLLKQYPKGDKVPAALLKQGFAFLNLGDQVDAKLLFKKVIKEHPNSPQAQIAANKLKSLN